MYLCVQCPVSIVNVHVVHLRRTVLQLEYTSKNNHWPLKLNSLHLLHPLTIWPDRFFIWPGYPTPTLRWLKDGLAIDESWTVTPQGIVRNELVITRLRRGDLMSTLVCEANNSNLTEAISTAISLELNCK